MNEETKKNINDNLEDIITAFNNSLTANGFTNVTIQNFRLQEEDEGTCLEWRWVRRSNGTYYRKCMRRSE